MMKKYLVSVLGVALLLTACSNGGDEAAPGETIYYSRVFTVSHAEP